MLACLFKKVQGQASSLWLLGHLSALKTQENVDPHFYWPGINADILNCTRRGHEYIKRSRPTKEALQPYDIPDQPGAIHAKSFRCIISSG